MNHSMSADPEVSLPLTTKTNKSNTTMPFFLITTIIQIALIIHVLKTGRERVWIFVLLFLPLIGGLAYLVVELLPEWRRSMGGQKTLRHVRETLDPGGSVRRWRNAWEQSPNVENARHYAAALIANNEYENALNVLDQAMSGLFKHEPNLLLLRARALFELERYQDTITTMETLTRENPDFKSADGHLLFARALEADQRQAEALDEYRSVSQYYPGVEARYRQAALLKKLGRLDECRHEVEQIQRDAKLAPAHFRKSQKAWLKATHELLNDH